MLIVQINKARRTPRSPPESSPFRTRTTSPSKKINTFSRRFSPSLWGSKGEGGSGLNFTGKFGARAARQASGTPASHSSAARGTPPFSLLALHAAWPRGAWETAWKTPQGWGGRETQRRRGGVMVVGGVILDGKKRVKLDQPARHPAGSGSEEPEGKCRSGRRPR